MLSTKPLGLPRINRTDNKAPRYYRNIPRQILVQVYLTATSNMHPDLKGDKTAESREQQSMHLDSAVSLSAIPRRK